MTGRRAAAVAGLFYPGEPENLARAVRGYLADEPTPAVAPKAIIAPHAGYMYSGAVAARAYATLAPDRDIIRRVVLVGPAHYVAINGLAVPTVTAFDTPLGPVEIDDEARRTLLGLADVTAADTPHRREHCLEVQLPFLRMILSDFRIVPIVVGEAETATVAAALEAVWGGPETVIVVSSDLSHYHDDKTARHMDRGTADAILAMAEDGISPDGACGAIPIRGLIAAARNKGLGVELLDLRNSGDVTGERASVVGYGAFAFF